MIGIEGNSFNTEWYQRRRLVTFLNLVNFLLSFSLLLIGEWVMLKQLHGSLSVSIDFDYWRQVKLSANRKLY